MSWQCGGCGTWYAPFVPACGCRKLAVSTGGNGTAPEGSGTATSPEAGMGLDLQDLEVQGQPIAAKNRTKNYYTSEFEAFWEVYPSNRDKFAAAKAFGKVLAAGVSGTAIITAAKRYAADPKRDPDHTKYAQGWLNDRRWEDDLATVAAPSVNPVWDMPALGTSEYDAWVEAEGRRLDAERDEGAG